MVEANAGYGCGVDHKLEPPAADGGFAEQLPFFLVTSDMMVLELNNNCFVMDVKMGVIGQKLEKSGVYT